MTNLINLNRSPLLAFVKGFFKKPMPVPTVEIKPNIGMTDKDAHRIIFLTVYHPYRERILFTTKVKCPVAAAPARIAARVALLKQIPDRARVWMTDDHYNRAQNWQYRYRILRDDAGYTARLIDPRRR